MGGISGNAGLFANAESIAPLLQMLLQKGSYNGKQYLNPNTINTFVQRTFPKSSNPRGLGFDKPSLEMNKIDIHRIWLVMKLLVTLVLQEQ